MAADASSLPPDWDAIARYLSGESSDAEAVSVRRWLDAHPADRELAEQLNAAARLEAASPPDVDVERALAAVHARMAAVTGPVAATTRERPRLTVERGRTSAAGGSRTRRSSTIVVGGLIAAGIVGVVIARSRSAPTAGPAAAATVRTYATGIGRRDSVRLADGSRVLLGPRSQLTVPADYGATTRAVELTGDAYFEVRHDATTPFSVRARGAVIEDIGTTFTIESDAGDGTSVAVVSGSVRLRQRESAPTAGVVLAAGDRGSLDASGRTNVEHHAVREEDVAWTTGRLVFNDAPLARVIPEFQRWYGVTIRVGDSAMLRRTVHTSFDGESADKALEILGLTLGTRIVRHGDTATVITPRGTAGGR